MTHGTQRQRRKKVLKKLILAAVLLCVPSLASAQWSYVGYARVTVDDTSGGVPFPATVLTVTGHPFPTQAFCFVESQDIRWTVDGTAPTTAIGNVATAGSALPAINGSDLLVNFRAIRDGGSDGTLSCSFFTGGVIQSPLSAGSGGSGSGGGGSVTQGTDPWIVALNGGNRAEDAAASSGQAVMPIAGVVNSTLASRAADGDYAWLALDVAGRMFTLGSFSNNGAAAGSNRQTTLPAIALNAAPSLTEGRDAALRVTLGGSVPVMITNAAGTASTIATDSTADSAASTTGPQVMTLGKNTTLPAAVTDGDSVRLLTDLQGRLTPAALCADDSLVSSVAISTASAGNVELVAISGSTVVTVCGFNAIATGTVAIQFISGTGTACATGETNKTGAYPLVANGGLSSGFSGAKLFAGAAGEAVCIELSAAIQVDGLLTYVQR